ncbi:MAG TPA: signal peptidase I [Actinomycetes bacterium]|nr:signal peptidase I [Actinomycetes bacterium]
MRRTGRSRRRGGLLAAAAALGALALAAVAGRLARLEPMLVQGESMRPTLVPGQRIAVGPLDRPPARGDLVVLPRPRPTGGAASAPSDRGTPPGFPGPLVTDPTGGLEVVKRVVGLPGERVRLAGGRIEVDGRVLHEPYLEGGGGDRLDLRLGPAEYLVLGDNRAASSDGRDFGPVPGDAFVGRVRFAYWPPRRVYRRPRPVHPPP